MKMPSDVCFLRRLHDHIHRDVAGLKTLGIDSDSYRAMLCADLFGVLPEDWAVGVSQDTVEQKSAPDDLTLEATSQSLRLECESREKVYDSSAQGQPQQLRSHGAKE